MLSMTALVACSLGPVGEESRRGDVDLLDKIRSVDLLPRFPTQSEKPEKAAAVRSKSAIYAATDTAETPRDRAQSTSTGPGYDLNFDNVPVATVAKVVLGDILQVGYTVDPRVQGTVTLASVRPVARSDIIFVLENALRLSGVVLIRGAGGYRLIPLAEAAGAGNVDAQNAQAEPGYGVSVVPLQHVSVQAIMKLVDSFATKAGSVRADTSRNMLIIQGSGAERRAAIDTVLTFDVDWMRGQSVGIFTLQSGGPEEVISELEKILDTGDNGLGQNIIKFQPVNRMNAIVAITRKPGLLRTAETWIKRLDHADTTKTDVHVYQVKYGDPRQMAQTLNNMFGLSSGGLDSTSQLAPGSGSSLSSSSLSSGSSSRSGLGGGTSGSTNSLQSASSTGAAGAGGFGAGAAGSPSSLSTSAGQGSTATSPFGQRGGGLGAAVGGGASGAGQSPLGDARILPDAANSTLLIYASPESLKIIQRAIKQIDRPQLQIEIDATVAEITLNDTLAYGVQSFLTSKQFGLKPDQGSLLNTASSTVGSTGTTTLGSTAATAASAFINRTVPGFNFLVGSEAQPSAILNALHTVTDVRVLSNPSVVVTNNQVAVLQVGNQVPISTGNASVLNSATATSNTIVNSIDYRDTGIILRVIPKIHPNGNVSLDLEQEISNVSSTTSLTPTIQQRKVKSSIAVDSGQTVLLAGLISENKEVDHSGIPVLDQIPKIGDVFSTNQSKTVMRTEIIMFIRPQIIRNGVDAHFIAEEMRTKIRGTAGPTSSADPRDSKGR